MKIISHRGNVNGPLPERENRPSYIDAAIQLGFEVEVDVRFVDGDFWLGHDKPQYKINLEWMIPRVDKIWYHCKDHISAMRLITSGKRFKFFCHKNDPYILTSDGHIWIHDLELEMSKNCIVPLLSKSDLDLCSSIKPHIICTDYVYYLK